jgi:hypothetical protein
MLQYKFYEICLVSLRNCNRKVKAKFEDKSWDRNKGSGQSVREEQGRIILIASGHKTGRVRALLKRQKWTERRPLVGPDSHSTAALKLTTVFTIARYWILPWASWIQYTQLQSLTQDALHGVQTCCEAHPPVGTRGSFPWGKATRAWSRPLICIMYRDQEWWSYTSTHPYVSVEWCLINQTQRQFYLSDSRSTIEFTRRSLYNLGRHTGYSECFRTFPQSL